ncbi:MAG: hypothetical protein V4757_09215 [Pseudomonadota bacterium]
MNRCKTYLRTLLLAACTLGALAPLAATAQTNNSGVREFPKAALRGKLVVTAPPEVTLNGKADRLSPGSRIRNTQSLLVMSGAIVGQELTVNYLRDSAGLIHEVWILNEAEAKEKRPGMTTARSFSVESDPPKIDPNTPYDKLPKYKP